MRGRVALAALALFGCGAETLDAVTGESCLEGPEQAACALPSWPNAYSRANSDAWLSAHHDGLRVDEGGIPRGPVADVADGRAAL